MEAKVKKMKTRMETIKKWFGKKEPTVEDFIKESHEETIRDVAIVIGSKSDWTTIMPTVAILMDLGITYNSRILSAHRTPKQVIDFATNAKKNKYKVIIAAAGGAAHLPGIIASLTPLPVIGIPIQSEALNGMDSLLSIVQMPGGIPVGTMAIGIAGAKNAALYAAAILALANPEIEEKLAEYRAKQTESVLQTPA